MFYLQLSVFLALWAEVAQAKNETLVHGWFPEPDGRGTWSLLWSCFATIFICTWSVLHLDVPNDHDPWFLLSQKVLFMLLTVIAPEYTLWDAATRFFEARGLSNHLRRQGKRDWTLTHILFALTEGFWIRPIRGSDKVCKADELTKLIESGAIKGPSISEEELKSRGKSDWIVKLVAVLQIIWFVVQTLVRAIQKYQVTALEIMTVGFVLCSIFTYGFYRHLPQDVEYPILLRIQDTNTTENETMPEQDSMKPNTAAERESTGLISPVVATDETDSDLSTTYSPSKITENIPYILLGLFASGFGATHCLAWNSPFPTAKERLAWRICSATTTGTPIFIILGSYVGDLMSFSNDNDIVILWYFSIPYAIARIALIVLAFMSLRALPADAFQTVSWSKYIPHFAT